MTQDTRPEYTRQFAMATAKGRADDLVRAVAMITAGIEALHIPADRWIWCGDLERLAAILDGASDEILEILEAVKLNQKETLRPW